MSVVFKDIHSIQNSPEPDLLSITDDLSLFGGGIGNIEFVVEEDDEELNTVIIPNSEESNTQQNIIEVEDSVEEDDEELNTVIIPNSEESNTQQNIIEVEDDDEEVNTVIIPNSEESNIQQNIVEVEGDDEELNNIQPNIAEVHSVKANNTEDISLPSLNDAVNDEEYEVELGVSQAQNICVDAGSKLLEALLTSKTLPLEGNQHPSSPANFQVNNVCYVPRCKVDPKNKNKVFWFRAPSDENLRKIWDICIDRSDKRLSTKDFICDKHFLKEDIIYQSPVRNANGNASEPGEPQLRQGAVPCIKFQERCCVPTCNRNTGRMFSFPVAYKPNFRLWCYMVKNPILKNLRIKELLTYRVCEIHFEPDCFENGSILSKTAAPTLFLPESNVLPVTNIEPLSNEDACNLGQSNFYLKCIHGNCNSRSSIRKNAFFFPMDPARCKTWLKACGKMDLFTTPTETLRTLRIRSYGVCEDHFDFRSFEGTLDKLKPDAVPKDCNILDSIEVVSGSTAFSSRKIESPSTLDTPNIKALSNAENPNVQSSRICFYKGCTKKPSETRPFFSFPKDKLRFNAWLTACGYKDLTPQEKELIAKNEKICGVHFKSNMFESNTKLKDDAVPVDKCSNQYSVVINGDGENSSNTTLPITNTIVHCAVENCGNYYGSTSGKGKYYKFPDPKHDKDRYNVWLRLLANKNLCNKSYNEISQNYMVCFKHFESIYLDCGVKLTASNQEAVPTLNLTADTKWFIESDYYKKRLLQPSHKNTFDSSPKIHEFEWRKDDKDTAEVHDKNKCVLENDGIRFPGMGYHLYMGQAEEGNHSNKHKFPYRVYKRFHTGYGINDVEGGETIRIHTAIIIDDNDESERAVLQLLANKRRRKL